MSRKMLAAVLIGLAAIGAAPAGQPAVTMTMKGANSTPLPGGGERQPLGNRDMQAIQRLLGKRSTEKLDCHCFRHRICDGHNCTVEIECYGIACSN